MDTLSKEERSKLMSKIRGKDTKPEITLRKLLFAEGIRYRLHPSNLPGKPDIFLPKYRIAIFVNGCFWHGHTNCKVSHIPKSNTSFWENKIQKNRNRDAKNIVVLRQQQIIPIIVWECSLTKDPLKVLEQIFYLIQINK